MSFWTDAPLVKMWTITWRSEGQKGSWLFRLLSLIQLLWVINESRWALMTETHIISLLLPRKESFLLLHNLIFLGHLEVSFIWLQLSSALLCKSLLPIPLTVSYSLIYSSHPLPPVPWKPVGLTLWLPVPPGENKVNQSSCSVGGANFLLDRGGVEPWSLMF